MNFSYLRNHMLRAAVATLALLVMTGSALAVDPVFKSGAHAIRGFDPVAYFTDGKPLRGKTEFTHEWNGATWSFSSAENLMAFKEDPEKFAPQYGGYCAWAVSQGYTASIDPQVWAIVDDKLYLNYSKGVQKRWEGDIPGHIAEANTNWPKILAE